MFWKCHDNPTNLLFFLVPAQSSSMIPDSADNIALSLKTSDRRGGIDSDDIRRLTKQKIYIPTTINELEHHLNHGIHILAIIMAQDCFLIMNLKQCQVHIQHNMATYNELFRIDNMFATKVLYIIDL